MSLRRFVVVFIVLLALVAVSAAGAARSRTERAAQLERLVAGDRHSVRWLASSSAPRTLERPRLLADRRRVLARHAAMLERVESRLSWLEAVDLVGRHFGAGVASWERSCSQPTSEGGWGRWVPNSAGSGAGGWLQFMPGTFAGVIGAAIADGRRRGMLVPRSAWSWYSPLGQALAGARMLAEGRRDEWAGWAC